MLHPFPRISLTSEWQMARVHVVCLFRALPEAESLKYAARDPMANDHGAILESRLVESLCVTHLVSLHPPCVHKFADIRVRYQNKNMHLPLCAEEGKHLPGYPEFCTLKAFVDRVQELTPVDWEGECSPSGKA